LLLEDLTLSKINGDKDSPEAGSGKARAFRMLIMDGAKPLYYARQSVMVDTGAVTVATAIGSSVVNSV
jgi:hypothetical protein